jgi:hypothetical protein
LLWYDDSRDGGASSVAGDGDGRGCGSRRRSEGSEWNLELRRKVLLESYGGVASSVLHSKLVVISYSIAVRIVWSLAILYSGYRTYYGLYELQLSMHAFGCYRY